MKKRKAALGGISVMAVLCMSGGVLAACGDAFEELPPYGYDYNTPVKDFGDGVKIDGKLDDSVWGSQRKFSVEDIEGYGVNFTMTSLLGDKGVYFAFDVDAPAVAYNAERDMYNNAGVEIRVGSPDTLNMTYEIGLYAGGNKVMRKYSPGNSDSGYVDYIYQIDSVVQTKGTINTSECKGYTIELYIPYNLFNADNSFTKPDHLLVAPAIIHSSNDSLNIGRDFYHDIGGDLGLSWAPAAANWLHFGANGLVCHDATLIASEGGALKGKDYVLNNDTYALEILPNSGYYCTSLRANGKDVTDEIIYTGGKAQYKVKTTAQDMRFEAQFAALPQTTHTLSGTVSAEGNGDPAAAKLYACFQGAVTQIAVGANGAYSVSLPEGEYTLLCESAGYLTVTEKFVLNADAQKDVSLVSLFLGNSATIGTASEASSWDFSRLGEGIAVSKDNGWLVAANHTTLYGEKAFVSADIVMNANAGGDPRTGFRFVDSTGKGYYVCLHAFYNRTTPSYAVQIIGLNKSGVADDGWLSETTIVGDEVHALATGSGVPFAVAYENGKVSAWVNGELIVDEYESNIAIGTDKKVVPGLVTCGGGSYYNLEFAEEAFENGYPVHIAKEGRGTVVCDKETYQAGDTLTFTVTPRSGYVVSAISVNGEDCLANLDGNTLTVSAGSRTAIAVSVTFAEITASAGVLSGTVTAGGVAFTQAATLTLTNADTGDSEEVTATDGTFTFPSLSSGVYELVAEAAGGYTYSARIVLSGNTQIEVALIQVTMAEKYGAKDGVTDFDISRIEEGEVRYTLNANTGESHIRFEKIRVKGSQDFWIESVMRVQDSFILNADGGNRQGYSVYTSNAFVHFTVGRWGASDQWSLMLNNWDDVDQKIALSPAQAAAYESTTGLKIAAARINGTIYMFAEENGVMKQVASSAWSAGATADCFLGLGVWYQNQSAEFKNLDWEIANDIPVSVDKSQGNHGTLTVSSNPVMGGTVTLTVTPDTGYIIGSLTVNGAAQTNFVQQGDSYVLTLENYMAKELNVAVSFDVEADLNVNLVLAGVPDGVMVSLQGAQNYSAVAVSGGKAAFTGVKKGTYTVKAEGYHDGTVTLTQDGNASVTLQIITAAEKYQAVDADNAYSVTESSGKLNITYTATANEGSPTLDLQGIAAAANEDIYVSTVLSYKSTFVEGSSSGNTDQRVAIAFFGAGRGLNCSLARWNDGYWLQLVDWGDVGVGADSGNVNLTTEQVNKYRSAAGLKIAAARINGKFYMFVEDGGVMKKWAEVNHPLMGNAAITAGVATWWQAKGCVFKDFEWGIGDNIPALTVNASGSAHGTVTATQNAKLGGNIVITVTPDSGTSPEYVCTSLTVNGTERIGDFTKNPNGTLTLTLSAWVDTTTVNIVGTFAERSEFAVSLDVKLHRLGVGTNNLTAVANGTEIILSGAETYRGTVTNGKVSFASVQKGEYTVEVDATGYGTATLNVTGAVTDRTVNFEYTLLDGTTTGFVLTNANDGEIGLKLDTGSRAAINGFEVGKNQDFYISGVFKNVQMNVGARLGFFAGVKGYDVNWSDIAGSNVVDAHIGGNDLQFVPSWVGAGLTDNDKQKLSGSTGLRIGLARANGIFYILKEADGNMQIVARLNAASASFMQQNSISVGLHIANDNNSVTQPNAQISGLQFETVNHGSAFADAKMHALITSKPAVYNNVLLVTDDRTTWKTEYANIYEYETAADLSEFSSDTNKKISWKSNASEIAYFIQNSDANKRLTFDFTLKANIPEGGCVTMFALWANGGAPYTANIIRQSNGNYDIQIIRNWDWDGGEYHTLSGDQVAKLTGEGLALRVVRDDKKVVIYDRSGLTSGDGWMCQREYTSDSVMADMGVGVSGSAAEFSNINVTNGCPWD